MLMSHEQSDLATSLARALDTLRRWRVPFVATPAATRLEQEFAALFDTAEPAPLGRIEPLEGQDRVTAQSFTASTNDTGIPPLRYFLDGVQRTFPLGWCGMSTLALAAVVCGVVERRPRDRVFHAVHGMTRVEARIIVASSPGETASEALTHAFVAAGFTVDACTDDTDLARPGDFIALQGCLRPAVMTFRDTVELQTFHHWSDRFGTRGDWLVVDGQLDRNANLPALGLIKQHNRFDLDSDEMLSVLRLDAGQRTSAFRRSAGRYKAPTTWYLRLHTGDGVNPLYGLARIEVPASVTDRAAIDALSRRIYAERTPRATNDLRWPTLLYPIHLTERILKTKLDRATHAVPGTLRRALREAA